MRRLYYELFESIRIAFAQILANKLRSALTALGVIIGIVAVTLMGTAIKGIDVGVDRSFSGFGDDILHATWPQPAESALIQDEVELVIQVNGKLRGSLTVARTLDKAVVEALAMQQPCVQKFLADGVSVRKIIVVPNKLINVVVG